MQIFQFNNHFYVQNIKIPHHPFESFKYWYAKNIYMIKRYRTDHLFLLIDAAEKGAFCIYHYSSLSLSLSLALAFSLSLTVFMCKQVKVAQSIRFDRSMT